MRGEIKLREEKKKREREGREYIEEEKRERERKAEVR